MKKNEIINKSEQLESEIIQILKQNVDNLHTIAKLNLALNDQKKEYALDLVSLVEAFDLKIGNLTQMENDAKLTDAEKKIMKSFESILRKINRLLDKNNIKEIMFDENKIKLGLCKIIDTRPDPTKEDGTILHVMKKGYYIGDHVLCEAEIITVKN